MKMEDITIYDMPIWMCALVDAVNGTCKKRLKASPEYRRILKESDQVLDCYRFISTLIDRDEIDEPMNLTLEQTKALSRFLALDADREDYERIQLYLMGCQHTMEVLQLLKLGSKRKERQRMETGYTEFCDCIKRIEENFMELDSAIVVDLKQKNGEYAALSHEIGQMEKAYPFLVKLSEGDGAIALTAEEHEILKEYLRKFFQKDNLERCHIYFRGHTDGYAYLKEIGAV